jgi:hypothetical protein
MMVMLLVTASMTGCAVQAPDTESEGATAKAEGSSSSALQNAGSGSGGETCPGGGAPACVKCSGKDCVWACAGDNTCGSVPGLVYCSYSSSVCRTFSFAPTWGKVMY